jgi:lantibiotic transport system ATP-binding protein
VTAALELHSVHFAHGRGSGVRGVSLRVEPGDCYGFLGHNGAGKTTVLRLCTGLLRPSSGRIQIFGADAPADPVAAHARLGALIERPGAHGHLSARTNLLLLAQLQGMPNKLAAAESDRVLARLGLAAAADRTVQTFSLGMRQRLGIAMALLGQPPLLLLDEPGNGLDPEGIQTLRTLLQELRNDGVAILVSSHQLAELDGICNRIGVLRDGAMVVEGELAHLRRQLGGKHRIGGKPLPALAEALQSHGLVAERVNEQLCVDLGNRDGAAVLRTLVQAGDVEHFAPEPATLEAIYLAADRLATAAPDVEPAVAEVPLPRHPLGNPRWPLLRQFGHELRLLQHQRGTWLLLLLPAVFGLWQAFAYRAAVQKNRARVQAGDLFSADAGSGFLLTAQSLQFATPVLALCLLWLGSQIVVAELAADTLRNTLLRAVRRGHVLIAKLAAGGCVLVVAWTLLRVAVGIAATTMFGFGDLEEVTRHGDRQTMAAAADVAPALAVASSALLLPLLATFAIGLAASTLTRRPTRALLLAILTFLLPELLRDRLRDDAGWLLTSHLPTVLRDDSGLGFAAAVARGAADALWQWQDLSLWTPAAFCFGAVAVASLAMRRLRVP